MIQKTISLFTAAAILGVYLWSQLQPNGTLFLFASANLLINIFLLALAWVMVRISFMNRFKTVWGYSLAAMGAVFCLVIGTTGLLSSGFNYSFNNIFGPLDFIFLTQTGVLLGIAALSYQHRPVNITKPSLKLPQLPIHRPLIASPKLAVHSTKLPHFG